MTAPAVLDWLLQVDNPSARYLALRYLLGRPKEDPRTVEAWAAILSMPQVQAICDAQFPGGYWIKPDRGYSPRHKATIWQLVALTDLGMPCTEAIARGCEHVLRATLHAGIGLFSAHQHSTGVFPCLNGDLLRVLWHFGYGEHEIVQRAAIVLAQHVLSKGWVCPRNGAHRRRRATWRPCLWGCVKVLRGFAAMPPALRGQDVCQAIEQGAAFLCAHNLARDQHPDRVDESSHWLQLGFPLGYGSDLLEALLALVELGVSVNQPDAVQVVADKRLPSGEWALEHPLSNAWADFGVQAEKNKWVTLRALRVLGAV
jgi:hypothetical protein